MQGNSQQPDVLVNRLLHFPLLHATECCQLIAKTLLGAGLSALTFLGLIKLIPEPSLSVILLVGTSLGFVVWAIAHYIMFLKRSFLDRCQCGHHLRRQNKPLIVFGLFCFGIVGFMLFCSWLCQMGLFSRLGGPALSSTILGAVTFLVPALFIGWLKATGRISAFEKTLKS